MIILSPRWSGTKIIFGWVNAIREKNIGVSRMRFDVSTIRVEISETLMKFTEVSFNRKRKTNVTQSKAICFVLLFFLSKWNECAFSIFDPHRCWHKCIRPTISFASLNLNSVDIDNHIRFTLQEDKTATAWGRFQTVQARVRSPRALWTLPVVLVTVTCFGASLMRIASLISAADSFKG